MREERRKFNMREKGESKKFKIQIFNSFIVTVQSLMRDGFPHEEWKRGHQNKSTYKTYNNYIKHILYIHDIVFV